MPDSRRTVPLYTSGELARYLNRPVRTVREWMADEFLLPTVVRRSGSKGPNIAFFGLVQAQLVNELRRQGLSMQAIRAGLSNARAVLGDRLLEEGRLATDLREIIVNLGESERQEWFRARDWQGGIPGLIEHGLQVIEWSSGYPQTVRLAAYQDVEVIADPRFAGGQPIDAATGTRIDELVNFFQAGDGVDDIAREFGVDRRVVEAAIRCHLPAAA